MIMDATSRKEVMYDLLVSVILSCPLVGKDVDGQTLMTAMSDTALDDDNGGI